jgi:hypothetical protein
MRVAPVLLTFGLVGVLWAQAPSPKPGSLTGTITDSVTHQGVHKATVTILSLAGLSPVVQSDEAGKFQVANLEPGSYQVEFVRAPGYLYLPHTRLAFAVTEDQTANIQLELTPLGVITGKATDSSGDPIVGAQVTVIGYTYSKGTRALEAVDGATTDDRGEYRIFNLKPGKYVVMAAVPTAAMRGRGLESLPAGTVHAGVEMGFAHQFFSGGSDVTQATTIVVPPAGEISGIDFRLRSVPVYHIRGKFATAKGAMPPNIAARPCGHTGVSDDLERFGGNSSRSAFDVSGLTAGVYCLTFSEPGWRNSQDVSEPVTITDRSVDGVPVRIQAPFPLVGTVSVEGKPADILGTFRLDSVSGGLLLPLFGGWEQDKLTVQNVIPGDYHVRLNAPANVYLKSVRLGTEDAPDGIIHVRGPETPIHLVIGTDAGMLIGKVRTEAGEPASLVSVTIAPVGPFANRLDMVRSIVTHSAGEFSAGGLAPGNYRIFAWGDADLPMAADRDFRALFTSHATEVTITAGDPIRVEAKLITAEAIRQAKEKY